MTNTGYKLVQLPLNTSILAPPPYSKCYPIGEVVEADPSTVGLMVFESLPAAVDFHAMCGVSCTGTTGITYYNNWVILKVEYDSSDVVVVDYISRYLDSGSLSVFYLDKTLSEVTGLIPPPLGTVCCKKLRVISELKGEPQP